MTPIGYFGNSVLFASEKSKWVVPLPLYRFIPYLEEKNFYVTNNLLDYLIPENEVLKFLNVLELGSDIDPSTIPLQLSFEIVRIYLDSLTDPIINVDYFSIKKSLQSDSQLNKVDAIKSIFDELDNNRKSVVYFVIRHMYNIFNNSQQNGVSAEEIAELFGKSLIYNNADFGYENVRNSFVRLVLEEFDYVSENVLEFGKTLGNPPNYPVGTGESKCHYLEDVELSVSKFVNKCDCGGMNEQIREENQSKKKGHYSQTVANKQSSVFKNGSQTGPKTPVRKVMTPDRFKRRSAIPQMIGELHQNKFTIGQCRKNASKSEQERSESGECTTRDLSPEYQEEKCEDLEKAKNPIATQFKVVVHSSRVSTFTPLSARTSSKLVISHEE
ncbi:hypothetical protein EIN_373990 [Entamoeba invadens IP1]|uniref:Rho-GAP domain-containing protein n=2 Tax=Entamoeba invadens TaxID=33085 RepID=A0A0A1TU36_ENTIV|nr:hypothetical protein EIN_373990 [Entamoeba invadens IP1]ELP83404.1 hypothetical protein EIN_373990 [Entamoeba invadens IP1]|eukprot:XP_004182750.1 hypothetical protein EIN_373990 [Entamoeba invadens IP1]